MGKRKSRAKPPPKKRMDKLDTVFCCPFCNHGSSVECHIDCKNLVGEASCRICLESFSTSVNALTEPIDMSVLAHCLENQLIQIHVCPGPPSSSNPSERAWQQRHSGSGKSPVSDAVDAARTTTSSRDEVSISNASVLEVCYTRRRRNDEVNKINHRETRDLTWKTLPMREGKTTGASQQQSSLYRGEVTTLGIYNFQSLILNGGLQDIYIRETLSLRRRASATLRPEAGLIDIQNLDHQSTRSPSGGIQDEPGVYLTVRELADGTRELRRVRFSRERFAELNAKLWWEENKERIQAQYL